MTRLATGVLCALCLVFGMVIGYTLGQTGGQQKKVELNAPPPLVLKTSQAPVEEPGQKVLLMQWQPILSSGRPILRVVVFSGDIDYGQNYGDGDGQVFITDNNMLVDDAEPCTVPAAKAPREIECPSELDDNGKPKPIPAYYEYY